MTRKIEVKELKEPDKLQVAFYNFMQVINQNRQKVYIGSAVICLILILAGGYFLYLLDYEKKANLLYTKVFNERMKSAATGGNSSINAIDVYTAVSTKYPSSRAAQLAQYRMGNHFYEQGEIDKAIKAYTAYLSKSSRENDIKTLAHTGLGYCYEAKKDYKNALASFQKALATKEGKYFASMTNRNIARVYEQLNDLAKAVEYYKKALTDTTDPSVQLLIKRKIATLS